MIRIFGKTDTSFLTNGDAVIRPIKAKVRKEDNGNYYLDLEAGLEYAEWFEDGRIVVADLPQGDQAFRYSFGLWLAVITTPPSHPRCLTVKESSGVGRSPSKI